jgi:hypothetical protein
MRGDFAVLLDGKVHPIGKVHTEEVRIINVFSKQTLLPDLS